MKPVVRPAEMAAIDADAPESVEELIERAGWATARAAIELLDHRLYGKRVAVLAGKGNNGADGRSAARFLEQRGARCTIIEVPGSDPPLGASPTRSEHRWDLVIDACVGTGLGRPFDGDAVPVSIGHAPVLAVDIPSGVDGATGRVTGTPIPATATVTFAAVKPGLLFHPGRDLTGPLTVADIGLDCTRVTTHLIEPEDVRARWPARNPTDHKRSRSVLVVGGSPGLTGAPSLVAAGALRSGVGHVTVSIPGTAGADGVNGPSVERGPVPTEAVEEAIPRDWAVPLLDRLTAGPPVGAVVIGPGLATDPGSQYQVRHYLASTRTPTVLDAGAIHALTPDRPTGPNGVENRPDAARATYPARARPAHALPDDPDAGEPDRSPPPTLTALPAPAESDRSVRHVLTPHDGEFRVLTGRLPGPDRIADCRRAAAALGAVVLLKGPTTVVAHPDGRVLLSTAGDERLATAGSGDVLAGTIAAGLAGGLEPFEAAALGAELHGLGACTGYRVGLVAGDLPSLIAATLSS